MIQTGFVALVSFGAGILLEKYRRNCPLLTTVVSAGSFISKILSSLKKFQYKSIVSDRIKEIARHGLPSLNNIALKDNFVLSYNPSHKIANWVMEHLPKEQTVDPLYNRKNNAFFEDESIPERFRATNEDYKDTSDRYDKGHLAAASNHSSDRHMAAQTYVLSNICPQVGEGFNRGVWLKLEEYCRRKARDADNLWMVTGPLFLPHKELDGKRYVKYEVIGKDLHFVSVPTHFFKVIVFEQKGEYYMESYVMANKAVADKPFYVQNYRIPIDTIEKCAGLEFFPKIPRHKFRTINGKLPEVDLIQSLSLPLTL